MAPQPEDVDVPLIASAGKYGVPAAIALWFTWWVTVVMPAQMKETTDAVRQNSSLLQTHVEMTSNALNLVLQNSAREQAQQERVLELLRQQCVNTAHNFSERQACLQAGIVR